MSRSKGKHLSKPNREFIEGGVRAGRSARDIAAARLKTSPPPIRNPAFSRSSPGGLDSPGVRLSAARAGSVSRASPARRRDVGLPRSRSRMISAASFPPSQGATIRPELLGELPGCFELRIGLLP